jgi:hypothetical protein
MRLALHLHTVAKRCPHARHEFGDTERLGHEIVGAEVERLDLACFLVERREHQNRRLAEFAEWLDQLRSVAIG